MTKKQKLEFGLSNSERIIELDGKRYKTFKEKFGRNEEEPTKLILIEFTKEKEEKLNKNIDEISDYIINKSSLNAKEILVNLLKKQSLRDITQLKNLVKKKENVEVKKGCLYISVGKKRLQVIN